MKKFLVCFALVMILTPVAALAQTTPAVSNGCSSTSTADSSSLTKCVNQIYIWSMGAAALLALVMIVLGGYITLTAAGNAERATRGKSFITSSLLGLLLLFGAYLLLRTINPDLVDFSNNCVNNLNNCGKSTTTAPQPGQ